MDNRVYVHVDNRDGYGDKDCGFPQGLGMTSVGSGLVIHGWGETAGFLHIPGFGRVALSCGIPSVSPVSTPLQLLRECFSFSSLSNST